MRAFIAVLRIQEIGCSMRKGFSLIEVMTVLVILSTLLLIACPSYLNYLTQARRGDGQAALIDLANRMERHFAKHSTYKTATLATGDVNTDLLPQRFSEEKWYILSIKEQTETSFSLAATPRNAQAINDKTCQTLCFNNLGIKGIAAGPSGEPRGSRDQCW